MSRLRCPVNVAHRSEALRSESESENTRGQRDTKHRVAGGDKHRVAGGDKHGHQAGDQGAKEEDDQQDDPRNPNSSLDHNVISKTVLTVNVPNDAETIIEHCYGRDWRTPRPKGIKTVLCVWYVQVLIFAGLIYWGVRLYKCYRILTKDRSSLVDGLPIARGKE